MRMSSYNSDFDYNTSIEFEDLPMPDIRNDWKQSSSLHGCGLHKNFTFNELCELEESLCERRILADVPTPDVIEFKNRQSKHKYNYKRNFPKIENVAKEEEQESFKSLKEKLKKELLKELLDEIKNEK